MAKAVTSAVSPVIVITDVRTIACPRLLVVVIKPVVVMTDCVLNVVNKAVDSSVMTAVVVLGAEVVDTTATADSVTVVAAAAGEEAVEDADETMDETGGDDTFK